MENLQKWFNDYKRYIKFQCEVLPHVYKYGGTKLHQDDFPSFKEFQSLLDTPRSYTNLFFAEEYDEQGKRLSFHNTMHTSADMNCWCKVCYSIFRGVRWNFKFVFVRDFPHTYMTEKKQDFINKYKKYDSTRLF